jgi:hypothetical protein
VLLILCLTIVQYETDPVDAVTPIWNKQSKTGLMIRTEVHQDGADVAHRWRIEIYPRHTSGASPTFACQVVAMINENQPKITGRSR